MQKEEPFYKQIHGSIFMTLMRDMVNYLHMTLLLMQLDLPRVEQMLAL